MPRPEPPVVRPRRRVSPWGLIESAAILAGLASLVGFAGRLSWLLELASHFRVQLGALLLLLSAVFALGRRWHWTVASGGFGLVNAMLVLVAVRPMERPADGGVTPRLRLLSINVHTANTRSDLVISEIRRTNPDIILLMEVDEPWLRALEPLRLEYPTTVAEPRADNFGIALMSRVPLEHADIIEIGPAGVPSIAATVRLEGKGLRLLGTHPLPPGTAASSWARNEQLAATAKWIGQQSGAVAVFGDLNATPWSPHFVTLLRDSGLRLSRPSWSLSASWPVQFPAALRIPLDHCLTSPGLAVRRFETGGDVGSDHLPLLVELAAP